MTPNASNVSTNGTGGRSASPKPRIDVTPASSEAELKGASAVGKWLAPSSSSIGCGNLTSCWGVEVERLSFNVRDGLRATNEQNKLKTFQKYQAQISELHGLTAAGRGREITAARKKVIALIRKHGLTIADVPKRTGAMRRKQLTTIAGK